MKKIAFFLVGAIGIPFLVYYGNINLKDQNLDNVRNEIYEKIDEVDNILLDCMSNSGNISLTQENKMDFAVRYIIENKDLYKEKINIENKEDYYTYENTLYYNFGKVSQDFMIDVINTFFDDFQFNIQEYKFYNNGYIELNFEPIEHLWYDNKKVLNVEKVENKLYNVYMEYNRQINDYKNTFYVEYVLLYDTNIKISNVYIYNSIMSSEEK